jgi:hypothetical protein
VFDLNEIAGLPAHPLLLHVPVVLIPILSGATIALMVRPDWRRRASRPLFASPALNEHAELGDQLKAVMVLFVGALVVFLAADLERGPQALDKLAQLLHRPGMERLSRVGISLLAVVAMVWVVRTGHEGAEVAWSQPSPLHQQSQEAALKPH